MAMDSTTVTLTHRRNDAADELRATRDKLRQLKDEDPTNGRIIAIAITDIEKAILMLEHGDSL